MEEAKKLLAEAVELVKQLGFTSEASKKAHAAIDALSKGHAPKPAAEGEVGPIQALKNTCVLKDIFKLVTHIWGLKITIHLCCATQPLLDDIHAQNCMVFTV